MRIVLCILFCVLMRPYADRLENDLGLLYRLEEPLKRSSEIVKKEYDFSQGKRGPVAAERGKTRVTFYLDNEVLNSFRARAESEGMGYQTMINRALREYLKQQDDALDEARLRRVMREELQSVGR